MVLTCKENDQKMQYHRKSWKAEGGGGVVVWSKTGLPRTDRRGYKRNLVFGEGKIIVQCTNL